VGTCPGRGPTSPRCAPRGHDPGSPPRVRAVTAARRKLTQVLGQPTPDVVSSARLDVRKARADLAVLRQRGAPASATDLALARLKVEVAAQRVGLTGQ
jgi:hypothetical protein